MQPSDEYFHVANLTFFNKSAIAVCTTTKILLTRMFVDQYKIVISLLEFKQPGRSLQQTIAWCDVICAKRLIHKN